MCTLDLARLRGVIGGVVLAEKSEDNGVHGSRAEIAHLDSNLLSMNQLSETCIALHGLRALEPWTIWGLLFFLRRWSESNGSWTSKGSVAGGRPHPKTPRLKCSILTFRGKNFPLRDNFPLEIAFPFPPNGQFSHEMKGLRKGVFMA